mgnify:CR=1 FL=1
MLFISYYLLFALKFYRQETLNKVHKAVFARYYTYGSLLSLMSLRHFVSFILKNTVVFFCQDAGT